MTTELPEPLRTTMARCARWTIGLAVRGLLAMVLGHLACGVSPAQQTYVLLEDAKVLVRRIEISPGETYTLPREQEGDVWTAIDPIVLVTKKDGKQSIKRVLAGEAAPAGSGEELQFHVAGNLHARLVIIQPKMAHQELTVGPFILTSTLDDASDRNATLLVAVSDCRFSDTRNLGDESKWLPSKADVITMTPASAMWISPGIHHFNNLGHTPAQLVSIEW